MDYIGEPAIIADQTLDERLMIEGKIWTSRRILTIPSGISQLYFDPIAAVGAGKNIYVSTPIFTAIGGDYVTITSFAGATYTGGQEQISINRNQAHGLSSPLSKVNYGGTLGAIGVEGVQWLVPSSSFPTNTTSGIAGSSIKISINENIITRLEINNTDSGSQIFEYNITWVEI